MPEGDTMRTVAQRLGPLLTGATLVGVDSRWPRTVAGLVGREVGPLRTHGKHLLVPFDDATVLRVHLGIKGSWHRYAPGERWRDPGGMGLVLATTADVLVCFYPKEVERIRDKALATHPVLSALGPDLLADDPDLAIVRERALRDPGRPLREVLLDQRVAAGIGNEICCEVCFIAGHHPETPVGSLGGSGLDAAYGEARRILHENVGVALRNTTGRRRPRTFVYGRAGRRCLRCGAGIRVANLGPWRRVTYWCPACQTSPSG